MRISTAKKLLMKGMWKQHSVQYRVRTALPMTCNIKGLYILKKRAKKYLVKCYINNIKMPQRRIELGKAVTWAQKKTISRVKLWNMCRKDNISFYSFYIYNNHQFGVYLFGFNFFYGITLILAFGFELYIKSMVYRAIISKYAFT